MYVSKILNTAQFGFVNNATVNDLREKSKHLSIAIEANNSLYLLLLISLNLLIILVIVFNKIK